jgi:hypothetical protein
MGSFSLLVAILISHFPFGARFGLPLLLVQLAPSSAPPSPSPILVGEVDFPVPARR